jgi:hypothetical protein
METLLLEAIACDAVGDAGAAACALERVLASPNPEGIMQNAWSRRCGGRGRS